MRLSDADLRGQTVIAADGLVLGEIVELVLDSESWRIEALKLKLRNEAADRIGAERSMFRSGVIEVSSRLVQSVGDAVLLSVAVDQLRPDLGEGRREEPAPST